MAVLTELLGAASSSENSETVIFELRASVLGIGFTLLAVVALLTIVVARRERLPDVGPRTLETPPQSPAVAALLVHTREVPGEVGAATLIDLAARGMLEILDMGGGTPAVRVTSEPLPPLTAYEKRVLDLIRSHTDAQGIAPAAALTLADDTASTKWLDGLRKEVRDEARGNGWVRSRYGREVAALMLVFVLGSVVLISWAYANATKFPSDGPHPQVPDEDLRGTLAFAAMVLGGVVLVAIGAVLASSAQRLTQAGKPLAAAWLGVAAHLRDNEQLAEAPPGAVAIWHRLLAYATGFGVAHSVQEALPLGPESRTRAWSTESGRWRVVRVRYPVRWPPGWGMSPGMLIKLGLYRLLVVAVPIAVILTVGVQVLDGIDLTGVPWWVGGFVALCVVPFFLVGIASVLSVLLGLLTVSGLLGPAREVTGLALRVRSLGEKAVGSWVALDDGHSDEVVAYKVLQPNGIRQGDRVHLAVGPLTGAVRSFTVQPKPNPNP